ncbi:uncharacterized protein LOC126661930 [Mercurialis annua]|uniref:uncharacterized protein LOC126661930 n=1 Tax=Mercurialis annua TaxID=3986 RepID=UPI0021608DD5|nr:uncharacterized protein LOC126661930 [Mercurialis annua]
MQTLCLTIDDPTFQEGVSSDRAAKVLFPQLNSLRFKELPELGRFCAGHPIEFRSLKELYIKICNALTQQVNFNSSEPQFLFNEMVGFSKLEELHLKHLDYLANIWHNQLTPNSFFKLKALCKKYFSSKNRMLKKTQMLL